MFKLLLFIAFVIFIFHLIETAKAGDKKINPGETVTLKEKREEDSSPPEKKSTTPVNRGNDRMNEEKDVSPQELLFDSFETPDRSQTRSYSNDRSKNTKKTKHVKNKNPQRIDKVKVTKPVSSVSVLNPPKSSKTKTKTLKQHKKNLRNKRNVLKHKPEPVDQEKALNKKDSIDRNNDE